MTITGEFTADDDFLTLSNKDLKEGELFFGLPAALIVLLLVFGAVVAGLVPVLLAIVAIVFALALVAIVGQVWEVSFFVVNMLTGMGLALGVDYALFIVCRFREERARDVEKVEAIAATGRTASRAVLFSGTAFVIALTGMLLVPDTILRSLAAGAILVGLTAVAAATTLLPAVLSLLGDRVDALRLPLRRPRRRRGTLLGRGRRARAAAAARLASIVSTAFLVAARAAGARPAHRLGGRPHDPGRLRVEGRLQRARARVRRRHRRLGADRRRGRRRTRRRCARGSSSSAPRSRATAPSGARSSTTAPDGEPRGGRGARRRRQPGRGGRCRRSSGSARRSCRRRSATPDVSVYVTGETAEIVDYRELMERWLPIVFAFVLGFSFVLLTVAFRSIVVPAKAIVLNLLSVGAAYGLIVLVFQKGVGNELFGFPQVDAIEAWLPLFLFSVLFGLSMDYHVFLLSRIRERYTQTGDTSEAVAFGVRTTARLITGAALIIVVVFVGFATGELVMFQQMGFGVAVALLLDAT